MGCVKSPNTESKAHLTFYKITVKMYSISLSLGTERCTCIFIFHLKKLRSKYVNIISLLESSHSES